jgi:hypothetical protein
VDNPVEFVEKITSRWGVEKSSRLEINRKKSILEFVIFDKSVDLTGSKTPNNRRLEV